MGNSPSIPALPTARRVIRNFLASEFTALVFAAFSAAASANGDLPVMWALLFIAWGIATFGIYVAEPLWTVRREPRIVITLASALVLGAAFVVFGQHEASQPQGWRLVLGWLQSHGTAGVSPQAQPNSAPAMHPSPSETPQVSRPRVPLGAATPMLAPPTPPTTLFVDCVAGTQPRVFPPSGSYFDFDLQPYLFLPGNPGVPQGITTVFGAPGSSAVLSADMSIGYRCDVSNYGSIAVTNVIILMHGQFSKMIRDPLQPNTARSSARYSKGRQHYVA